MKSKKKKEKKSKKKKEKKKKTKKEKTTGDGSNDSSEVGHYLIFLCRNPLNLLTPN